MAIEKVLRDYLKSKIDKPVYLVVSGKEEGEYITIEKLGGSRTDMVWTSRFAIQTHSTNTLEASIDLMESVKEAMDLMDKETDIGRARYETDYNFPNLVTKEHRQQAIYILSYV